MHAKYIEQNKAKIGSGVTKAKNRNNNCHCALQDGEGIAEFVSGARQLVSKAAPLVSRYGTKALATTSAAAKAAGKFGLKWIVAPALVGAALRATQQGLQYAAQDKSNWTDSQKKQYRDRHLKYFFSRQNLIDNTINSIVTNGVTQGVHGAVNRIAGNPTPAQMAAAAKKAQWAADASKYERPEADTSNTGITEIDDNDNNINSNPDTWTLVPT